MKEIREEHRAKGDERLTPESLEDLWTFMHSINDKLVAHMAKEEQLQPKVDELLEAFNGAKGVLSFIKICAAVGGSVAAAFMWLKDHVKFN